MDIGKIVESLREEGSDYGCLEAKSAAGGFPENIIETMCGFANRPNGGTIVFGLDESNDFAPVKIYNTADLRQRLTQIAQKGLVPAVIAETETLDFEGEKLVVCVVEEAERSTKPVVVAKTGKAYIRQYDGDFVMSAEQKQMFVANRGPSKFDQRAVENATFADLDKRAVSEFVSKVRPTSAKFAELTDSDILLRQGALSTDKKITLAGLLALGFYPQQFVPNYSIQASVQNGDLGSVRAANSKLISGSIPEMIEQTVEWVRQNSSVYTANTGQGKVRNLVEYPDDAIRELVANALIHRDLNPVSMTTPVVLIIKDNRLILTNPGGLSGVSVENLGRTTSHSRNEWLSIICRNVSTADGANVVERIGSGIPIVMLALETEFRPPARFFDEGIRFTAVLTGGRPLLDDVFAIPAGPPTAPAPSFSSERPLKNDEVIYNLLKTGEDLTRSEIVARTGVSESKSRYALRKLLAASRVRILGKPNSPSARYTARF